MRYVARARAKLLAAVLLSVPAIVYFASGSASDPLYETLENYGYLPLTPPSNLMDIGSLYFVSADARRFSLICGADENDVKGMTKHSNSVELEVVDHSNQSFVASAETRVMKLLGTASDGYVQTERFVLKNISLDEISLEDMGAIYQKMIEKPECNQLAMKYLRLDGYVCQEQKILRAAGFQLAKEADWQLSNKGEAEAGGEGLKSESELGNSARLLEQSGPATDLQLTFGVAMTPQCMAPADARFARILPGGRWDQAYNYFLFKFVEPAIAMFSTGQVEVAVAPSRSPAER